MNLVKKNYTTGTSHNRNFYSQVISVLVFFVIFIAFTAFSANVFAQGNANAAVSARMDARQIMVGDQARIFIEVKTNPSSCRVEWAAIPDTFNDLEIVERGKIDTIKDGGFTTYKQRLLITGFDSGNYKIPAFVFPVIPTSGTPYTLLTDSFQLQVQTVAVDTTKAFKGIKNIIDVKSSWRDYILYIIAGFVLLLLIIALIVYLVKRNKKPIVIPQKPVETLQEKTLRQLTELESRQLWQKNKVKEYYVELTDIVRSYVELRFQTPAMELTTDELLYKIQLHKELQPYHSIISTILHTADLAKFAKAQPLPQEHMDAMEKARQFVETSTPVVIVTEKPIEKTI